VEHPGGKRNFSFGKDFNPFSSGERSGKREAISLQSGVGRA